ncbi:SCO family protein [Solimonas terrae]|uniref:SCO family protein n=1 Tax=Solimonas terrae TaxID=1396819 RepID=A0A6M2BW42_9GAMM|nr:SCO family protein [Solimonas terrae]NGY06199.1 SCO family protein [Solimonas terrae]
MTSKPPTGRGLQLVVIGALALMVGLIAAIWLQKPATVDMQSGTLLQTPRPLTGFKAIDQDGQPFGLEQMQGHWTLIFPGFTSCPDVCPTTLALLRQVDDQLGSSAQQLHIDFLSVDPDRDTPARLKQYVAAFDPRFTAMTAPEPELQKLARMLGVAYAKVPGKSADDYTMDHSAALILIDPQARIAGYMTPPFDAAKLSADLRSILNRS